jgi:hypothetical protein
MADSFTGLGYLYMRQGKIQDAIKVAQERP